MPVSRITKLKGFDRVLVGRDMLNIFKEGHVYNVREIMGQIMITDLGEHAELPLGDGIAQIMVKGTYCLTKEEDEKQHNR